MDCVNDVYAELERTLPPAFGRTEVERLMPGLIASGTLANLDCAGEGPPSIPVGRKVGYLRGPFVAWLRSRGQSIKSAEKPTPPLRQRKDAGVSHA